MKRKMSDSAGTFTFGAPAHSLRKMSASKQSSPSTTTSIREGFSGLKFGSPLNSPRASSRKSPRASADEEEFNTAMVAILLTDGEENRFAPYNCSFVYNPKDKKQVAEFEKKMASIDASAKMMGVQYEVLRSGFTVVNPPTQIGGVSRNFVSKAFPPPTSANWVKKKSACAMKKQKSGDEGIVSLITPT